MKIGDTVVLAPTKGVFVRRALVFGRVIGEHEENIEVLWSDGHATSAHESAIQAIDDPSPEALTLLGRTMRPEHGPAKQMGQRGEGVVVAVYAVEKTDHVAIETALGLIISGKLGDFKLVPNK